MPKKAPPVPKELTDFINSDRTTFHCNDGDWELRVERQQDAEIGRELPPRSTVIAENGSGDFLFLKSLAAGKFDSKVYVYWHEEERHEVFAKQLKDLMAKSTAKPAAAGKKPVTARKGPSVAQLDAALKSSRTDIRLNALRKLAQADLDVEALPALRRALNDTDVEVAIEAAQCIGKLGPIANESPAAESSDEFDDSELEEQLMRVGAKVWSYSGYPNCYGDCLDALVKIGADEDFIIEFVHDHIGLSNPDDLMASLEALKSVGTREAIDLLKRAATFWAPELNLAQAKKVKAIVAAAGASRKK